MGINTGVIGHKTQKKIVKIDDIAVSNYLEAISSSNPLGFYSRNKFAPPMFNVALEISHIAELWSLEELHGSKEETERNVLMLVHGEQKMTFNRLLKLGEEITTHSIIENVQEKGRNYIVTLKSIHEDSKSKETGTSTWTLFIRAEDSKLQKAEQKQKAKSKPKMPEQTKPKDVVLSSNFHVPDGVTHKYAEASGDKNKIHVDPEYAKKAGLDGVIVHGLCTMAMTLEQITDNHLSGFPGTIKEVSLRFSSPVWPGDNLVVQGWEGEEGGTSLMFEVHREGSDTKVIKSGKLKFENEQHIGF
jgi:acyl dehydratase